MHITNKNFINADATEQYSMSKITENINTIYRNILFHF